MKYTYYITVLSMITTSTFLLGSEYTPKFKFTDLITYGSKNPRDIEVPLLTLNGKTYYEILDVTPNVSSDEVQEAYINKRQEHGINPRNCILRMLS